MDNELFDDMLESLNQALDYTKGDTTKGRSHIVTVSDEEVEAHQLLIQKISSLNNADKQKATRYVDGLLQASSG